MTRVLSTVTGILLLTTTALLGACATSESAKAPASTRAATQSASPTSSMKTATANVKVRTASEIGMAEILDDPKKLAVLRKHAPALAENPQLSMARGMTLADVATYAQAGLTAPTVQSIVEDLNRL
jgi:hypothetical protein